MRAKAILTGWPEDSVQVMGGECCGCANWTEVLGIPVPEGGEGAWLFGGKKVGMLSMFKAVRLALKAMPKTLAGCTGFSPTWKEAAQPFYEILKDRFCVCAV